VGVGGEINSPAGGGGFAFLYREGGIE